MGTKMLLTRTTVDSGLAVNLRVFTAGRRAQKKSPTFALKTGDFTRMHLHSLILEDLFVRNIQAGLLTLPTLTRLPILSPELVKGLRDSGFSC